MKVGLRLSPKINLPIPAIVVTGVKFKDGIEVES